MKCPKCGYENGSETLACGLCGEVLKRKGTTAALAPATEGEVAAGPPTGEPGEPDWASFGPPSGPPYCFETGRMNFAMPRVCACCLGPGIDQFPVSAGVSRNDGGQRVTYTTTWQFPFCLDCTAHLKGHQRSWGISIGLAILLWVIFAIAINEKKATGLDYALVWGLPVVVLIAAKVITGQVFPKKGHRCASLGRPVKVSGPHGGQYHFTFYNPTWGRIFAEFNS